MKRKLSLVLSLILMLSTLLSVNVFAAAPPTVYTYPSISSSKYIEFTAQESINVYKDTACKTRGTSSPSKKYNASISKNDVCYIYKITESYIQVNYPTSSGRRTGYIKRGSLFDKTSPTEYIDSSAHKVQVYKTKEGGYVAKGDKVWKVDPSKGYSGYRAVIYEAKSGKRAYKMGYVTLDGWDDIVWSDVPVIDNNNNWNNNLNNYDDSYISLSEINKWAKKYDISQSSNAYNALLSINTKYASKIKNKKGTNVFVFEGVGTSSKANERFNAMCVVVKNKEIVYLNRNSTTIPDRPFDPKCNADDNTPTLISGIYKFSTTNHQQKYAALNVNNAKVVRFQSKNNYEKKTQAKPTSTGINVHRRGSDTINKTGIGNSAGCLNIGKAGTSSTSEYAQFIQAIGIVPKNANGNAKYSHFVSGQIVIDRVYAEKYLKDIGYPSAAIKKIIG
ncbi:MAG: hypothetical protein E7395_03570 [Ruminococcaceae bacterium]|nr:hypothetical protein [Oscillospiraceae bacterium]